MKRYRSTHLDAYNYVQLLWKPKKGDRVYYKGKKYDIQKMVEGKGVKLQGLKVYVLPGELVWRPTPSDFNAVLFKLRSMWVYRELIGNRQIVGVSVNGRVRPVAGRPAYILSHVLGLRVIDPQISVSINRLFERAFTGKKSNVRISHSNTKSRGLT